MSQSKIQQVSSLFPLIISDIKKDIKSELVKFDYKVFQKLFGKCHIAKLSVQDLVKPLFQEIEGNSKLEEWIIERWIEKNADMYHFFARLLMVINPKFEEIKLLSDSDGEKIVAAASEKFGLQKTYLFSLFNGVAFSPAIFEKLAAQAVMSS
jgi:hypothetical protein